VATAEESKEEPVTLIVTFPLPAVALVGRILDRTGVCWVMLKALTADPVHPPPLPPVQGAGLVADTRILLRVVVNSLGGSVSWSEVELT
jgi:hypothetical protein